MLYKICIYFERIGIALSVLINVILGGESNQTFSARNYARKRNGFINLVWLIDKLFYKSKGTHCMESWTYWYVRSSKINIEGDKHEN